MDLREAILTEHSKAKKNQIADYVGGSKDLFQELWGIVKSGEEPVSRRAAWALEECVERNPALFDNIMEDAIAFLPGPHHSAIHRHISKILSLREIPEEYQGMLYSLAIDWMLAPTTALAVKVFCMSMAYNIAKPIPELREELALVIKDQMDYNTAGFKSRGRKILKLLNR
jgi:hypothetical protein